MKTLPDTTSILRAVLDSKEMFPHAHRALPAIVIKLVADEVKSRTSDLVFLRNLNEMIGKRDFDLMLDAVPQAAMGKAVKAADKDNPELKAATPDWVRKRLLFLVEGGAPYEKPPRPAAKARSRKVDPASGGKQVEKKETDPTKAKSSKAKWDGKNRDGDVT